MTDIVERLRSSEPLPACPYDKLSPHYWTAPNDKPCAVCGGLNDPDAPDLCRGADTRIMGEAAGEIERLRAQVEEMKITIEMAHDRVTSALASNEEVCRDCLAVALSYLEPAPSTEFPSTEGK